MVTALVTALVVRAQVSFPSHRGKYLVGQMGAGRSRNAALGHYSARIATTTHELIGSRPLPTSKTKLLLHPVFLVGSGFGCATSNGKLIVVAPRFFGW